MEPIVDLTHIETALRKSLDDYRLSRAERKGLAELITDLDEHQQTIVRHQAFELARNATIDPETSGVVDWLEDVVKTFQATTETENHHSDTSEALFSSDHECHKRICTLLDVAKDQVDICVFTITDNRIRDSILRAHKRKVRIRIITDAEKAEDDGSDIDFFRGSGIPVRVDRSSSHMHHKYAIFDNRRLLTGSYNWTRSASKYNEENLIITNDRSLVEEFQKHFDRLWHEYR